MSGHLDARRQRHFAASTKLASLSDRELLARLGRDSPQMGWGRNQVLKLGRSRIFVKRIPVTDREMVNLHSTRNHYRLPTWYNYGVGSAGFGVFRELLGHVKTTNWVLDGEMENFPLLHHHRIVPLRGRRPRFSEVQLSGYTRYWANSRRIRRYIVDRLGARFELLLFLEHFPHTAAPWLRQHEDGFAWLVAELQRTVAFLQKNHIVHFDCHTENVVTDGCRAYLSDFGLVLDADFELSDEERTFLGANRCYDEGELLFNLGSHLLNRFTRLREPKQAALSRRYGFDPGDYRSALHSLVVNVEDIATRRAIALDPGYVDLTVRYRPVIGLVHDFFSDMHAGSRKDIPFPHSRLKRLLKTAAGGG